MGVKEVGWRFFDRFRYLSSSCCLFFSSMWSIVLLLLPSSVVFLLSGAATTIWQDRRSMQGCLGKIFLFFKWSYFPSFAKGFMEFVRWLIFILILWPLLKPCLQSSSLWLFSSYAALWDLNIHADVLLLLLWIMGFSSSCLLWIFPLISIHLVSFREDAQNINYYDEAVDFSQYFNLLSGAP